MINTINSLQVAYKIAEDEFLERIKHNIMSLTKVGHKWSYSDAPDTFVKHTVGFTIGPDENEKHTFLLWIYHNNEVPYPCIKYYKNGSIVKNLRYNMNICISDIIEDIMKILTENSEKIS